MSPASSALETVLPYTGNEFLDSLDDGSEVWIYGERVRKITEHPAFRNCARMIARLYDALHADHAEGKRCSDLSDGMGRLHPQIFRRIEVGGGAGRRA